MRAHRAIPSLAALILLAACSSESSQVGGTATDGTTVVTSPRASTAGPSTSAAVTDSTLAGVWVQPTGSPTLYFTDDRGTADAPASAMIAMDATGAPTELWSEAGAVSSRIVDVSADGTRVLVSRYSYSEGVEDYQLVERVLAGGAESTIATRDGYFTAQYTIDGSGDLFVTNEMQEVADGIVTRTTSSLDRIGADGAMVANLFTVIDPVDGMPWLQVMLDGELVVLVGGAPMTLVGGLGQAMSELAVGSQLCNPVRTAGDGAVVASCHPSGPNYFHQLWLVPLDGTAPTPITELVDEGSGVDFGAGDLWTTANGRQFVQRYGDCGAAWVEELLPDGSTIESDAAGVILGVDGTRLLTAANGACDGYWATIAAYDTATGVTTTFLAPPDVVDDHPYGVNAFDILAAVR